MMSFYLRFAFIPIVLLTTALMLLRIQPSDNRHVQELLDLGDFLTSDDCPAPCFMGIQPGVTTAKEAIALLEGHPWVGQVIPYNAGDPSHLWWVWGDAAPDFLRRVKPNNAQFPVHGEVRTVNRVVSSIGFDIDLTLNDVALTWGIPAESRLIFGGILLIPDPSRHSITAFPYERRGFWASGSTDCPYDQNIWETPVTLRITNQFHEPSLGTVFPVQRLSFIGDIHQISFRVCGF